MNDQDKLTIQLLDKSFQVRCPEDSRPALQAAARFLDARMREVRDHGRVVGMERVAMMTALNITYDFLELKNKKEGPSPEVTARLEKLHDTIDTALIGGEQLELDATHAE